MSTVTIKIAEKDHVYGSKSAPLELIEYGDYECPYCGLAYPIVKNIQHQFSDNLRFVFRNFPWSKIHPHAFAAAVASEAAAMQNAFWEMHDLLFENQKMLSKENFLLFADKIGLDIEQFQEDLQRPELATKVREDFEEGVRLAVNRTPTFFLNGKRYEGHLHEDQLLTFIKEELYTTQ